MSSSGETDHKEPPETPETTGKGQNGCKGGPNQRGCEAHMGNKQPGLCKELGKNQVRICVGVLMRTNTR